MIIIFISLKTIQDIFFSLVLYQYYLSDDGDILVYERFEDAQACHTHIDNWDAHAERWMEAATPTRMVHLGDLPEDVCARHAAISPILFKPLGGFAK